MVRRIEVNEVITEVTKVGTGAHCFLPKAWIGKKVKVTVIEE
jgi:putative transposon-encoded protein